MTDREIPPDQTPEKLETADNFDASTRRLFQLADSAQEAEIPTFYNVQWSEEQPGMIESVTLMEAMVTGARKQEHKGRFNQVQVKITEVSDDEKHERQRFIWIRTGFQPVGIPVDFDRDALASDYGYHELGPHSVAQTLAVHVQSIDNYLTLIKEMKARDVPPSLALKMRATKLINKFIYSDLISSNVDLTTENGRNTVAELISLLETGSVDLAEQIQGSLLNQLLKAIATGPVELEEGKASLTQDQAASVLEAGLREGIIPPKPHYKERILRTYSLYQYPFVVDLLHKELIERPVRARSKNIFGVERSEFVGGYMANILDTRAQGVRDDPDGIYIDVIPLLIPPSYKQRGDYFATLVRLANKLKGDEEVESSKGGRPDHLGTAPTVADLRAAKEAFLTVLQTLRSDNPEVAESEQEADRQHEQIIDIILRPAIQRRLGREMLGVTDTTIDPSGSMPYNEDS